MTTVVKISMAVIAAALAFVLYETLVLRGGMGALAIGVASALVGLLLLGWLTIRYQGSQAGRVLARSWLLLWSAAVSLLVLDLLTAFLFLGPLSPPAVDDPVLHHRLVPDARIEFHNPEYSYVQRVNTSGFRGDEVRPRDSVDLRILMLGDSFTMGKGVPDGATFSALVQQKLSAEPASRTVEVINAGVDSYAPIIEYLQLVELLPRLMPDVVVMNLDPADGVQELAYRKQARFDAEGQPVAVPPDEEGPATPGRRLREWVMRRTFLMRLALYYVYEESGLTPANVVSSANPAVIANTLESDTADRSAEFDALFRSIEAAAKLCSARGVRFVLTLYPWGHQVAADEWEYGRRYFMPDGARPSDRSRLRVRQWAEEEGIEILDAFDAFRRHEGSDPLYFDHDMHWTQKGHEVMADAVAEYLQTH